MLDANIDASGEYLSFLRDYFIFRDFTLLFRFGLQPPTSKDNYLSLFLNFQDLPIPFQLPSIYDTVWVHSGVPP